MKIYKLKQGLLIEENNSFYHLESEDWDNFINREDLYNQVLKDVSQVSKTDKADRLLQEIVAPIGSQEIWAAGVTYFRSRVARLEESKSAGGGDFYDRVYEADRPEIFFKSTAKRTAGPGESVKIRKDSTWDVPEPELTLFVNSKGNIQGYTVGNDMSSRSIEGENPLYLPQAKTYDRSAAIGPCLYITEKPLSKDSEIGLEIFRNGSLIVNDKTTVSQIKRSFEELVEHLFRECSFPDGCFLMTGTGIIPSNDFTLKKGDEIKITIEPIGTLINFVD